MEAKLLLDAKATLGEGPVWDEQSQLLYWIDIIQKQIHIHDIHGQQYRMLQLDQFIGAIVHNSTGGLVAALQHGFYHIDLLSGELTAITDPERDQPDNRFNDGKCDPAGRFIAGTMSLTNKQRAGALYSLDTNNDVRQLVSEVGISNGLAWNAEGNIMYYIDTHTGRVDAFDYELQTGEISNRRTVIHIASEEGAPDGMTIDEEGMLWIAHWGGKQVARWNPHTGQKLTSIYVPASHVTCCTFGGPNMDQLFITTASVGISETSLLEQPHAGSLFTAQLDVKGFPAQRFKGK